ncbi:hypothetical protein B7486_16580 [cyanobacterium TDX16]|nr:hypothetical protein B7486_16580 [cyanobacterium TDX16]
MAVLTLNPIADGAGYVAFDGSTYARHTDAVLLRNGAPSGANPHQAPFMFYPVAGLLALAGLIQAVHFLWTVSDSTPTDATVGVGFHDATIESADASLFASVRNINNGYATQIVNATVRGPFVTDLGAGGVAAIESFILEELDIGFGLDYASGAATWGCTLSQYLLRITYTGASAKRARRRMMGVGR